MRYVLRRFSEAFEILVRPERYVRLDDELARNLQELVREVEGNGKQMAVRRAAADILRFGMTCQWASEENLLAWEALTPREQEVAALVCRGYSNREIAQKLVIAVSTVKTHIRSVLRKFRVNGKLELKGVLKDWDFSGWES